MSVVLIFLFCSFLAVVRLLLLTKWFIPLCYGCSVRHTPPSSLSLSLKLCTPHPVSGGISCASPGRPHTHTRTHTVCLVENKASSTASWRRSLPPRSVRPYVACAVLMLPRRKGMTLPSPGFFGKRRFHRGTSGWFLPFDGIFLFLLMVKSWNAGRTQREQQVGEIRAGC